MSPVSSPNFLTRSRTSGDRRSDKGFDFDVSLGISHKFHSNTTNTTIKYINIH